MHESAVDVTLNDLLIKACACALMEQPAVNIQWVEGEIRQFSRADIAVVTAVQGGLATPIIRSAEAKTVQEICRDMKALSARATKNALRRDEVFGGTFSLSNLGMYGVDEFDAIINPPQCAILAVGSVKRRWVVSQDDRPRIASVLRATLSVDHRALDGVVAARFLATLRRCIEHPQVLVAVGCV
jgi:pyruvate dehydrogenase E2 component (dihydrolipoamide acetyltransferase)